MTFTPLTKTMLRIAVGITLAFIYIPLLIILLYSLNPSQVLGWPPEGFTLSWFPEAIKDDGAREALLNSLKVATVATAIALVLGTLAALAVSRHRFFGRDSVSFLVLIPIALPGIVTGIALNATFTQVMGIDLTLWTVIIAHATFCVVLVFNNAAARLRRMSTSLEDASADLGATPWTTFRRVTIPNMRSALVAGGLLAFALSFDEIVVTNFTIGAGEKTLPVWIFEVLFRPNQPGKVYAVAVIAILLSMIPVYIANRMTREESTTATGAGVAAPAIAEP
ncbi:MAG: putative spermidine/putrescine transport system permease protein [Actinomycetota bacterium]|nr:putative spermidine/putrescine transport system permease protein [Actinomycetota bacterium]